MTSLQRTSLGAAPKCTFAWTVNAVSACYKRWRASCAAAMTYLRENSLALERRIAPSDNTLPTSHGKGYGHQDFCAVPGINGNSMRECSVIQTSAGFVCCRYDAPRESKALRGEPRNGEKGRGQAGINTRDPFLLGGMSVGIMPAHTHEHSLPTGMSALTWRKTDITGTKQPMSASPATLCKMMQ